MSNFVKKNEKSKDEKYPYPSHYGSHKSMVTSLDSFTKEDIVKMIDDLGLVVCQDEFGHYITPRSRLDSRQNDPNRTDVLRMKGAHYQSMVNIKDQRK